MATEGSSTKSNMAASSAGKPGRANHSNMRRGGIMLLNYRQTEQEIESAEK